MGKDELGEILKEVESWGYTHHCEGISTQQARLRILAWCLEQLPEKKHTSIDLHIQYDCDKVGENNRSIGWNDCVDEIKRRLT